MMRQKIILAGLLAGGLVLAIPTARTQAGKLRIYFVDIGQGHAALLVSPTGRAMLIDGGPDGAGASAIVPLMESLGLTHLDVMVATHYDGDHIGGLDEVAAAFPPAIAYDSGDLTAPNGSAFFARYLNAVGSARTRIRPGDVVDLGGGVVATCIVVNGDLISGGRVGISGRRDQFDQLGNSASIGLLIQYGDFDLFISGDLTGGGNNTTDVESVVAQIVGDVDMVQLNHHGSDTSSSPTFLDTLKAEVGIVQAGQDNTFGHPRVEVINRFINTAPTDGIRPEPPEGDGRRLTPPIVFQTRPGPSDSRASRQGFDVRGTIVVETDGGIYSVTGGRLLPDSFIFQTDGAESGLRTDFPPSVVLMLSPVVPQAGERVLVRAQLLDDSGAIESATLTYTVGGGEEAVSSLMPLSSIDFIGFIPGQPDGTRIEYSVTARDGAGQSSLARGGYFAGATPIEALQINDALGVPRFLNFPARIAGTATVGSGTLNSIYVQDMTGGISVFQSGSQATPVARSDRVSAVGRLSIFSGILELDITNPLPYAPFPSPFGVTKTGERAEVSPVVKTLAEINESVEGMLVQVNDVRIKNGSIPTSGQSGSLLNLVIADATGEITLRVLQGTGIPGMPTPQGKFSIVGIVSQFDRFRPFNEGYQLLPRSRDDFIGND